MVNPAPAWADPLGAPASVTLTPGRRLIKVEWTAPVNPNGTVATYVATASTGETCTVNAPTSTCNITGVAANTNITVSVKACPVNQADCSAATQGAGPVRAGPPGTPAAPTVVFKGNPNAVTLSWAAPDPARASSRTGSPRRPRPA